MRFKSRQESINAHKYFERNFIFQDPLCRERVKRILSEIEPGSRVLDVGCNTGEFGKLLIEQFGCDVYGVDVSVVAKFWAPLNKIKYYHCPVEETPFKDNFFDTINISETLEHLYNLDDALVEVGRILRNGGKVIGTVPHEDVETGDMSEYHQGIITEDLLREMLVKYFKIVYIETLVGERDGYSSKDRERVVNHLKGKNQNLFFRAIK